MNDDVFRGICFTILTNIVISIVLVIVFQILRKYQDRDNFANDNDLVEGDIGTAQAEMIPTKEDVRNSSINMDGQDLYKPRKSADFAMQNQEVKLVEMVDAKSD